MTIGGSIFLIAVGAILRYAITASIAGVDIQTIGLILMIAGGIGLLITLFLYAQQSRKGASGDPDRQPVEREEPPPRREPPPPRY